MIAAVERAVARVARRPELLLRKVEPIRPASPAPAPSPGPPKKTRRTGHKLRTVAGFAGIFLLATLVTLLAFEYVAFLKQAERWVDDVRVATMQPAEPQHPEIVIAAITEDTLALFPYRSPVNRVFLANLLKQLEERGAKAIALDVLFDQPTEPEGDELLYKTIRELRTPLVVTYADNVSGAMTDDQQAYLDKFLPPRFRAMGNLATDVFDDTVRRVHPGHTTKDGTFIDGFARAVAKRVGIERPAEEVAAVWRAKPNRETAPFAEYPAHLVGVLPPEWFKDKIVLIGAEYTLVDRHRTPYRAISEKDMPGIVIHAHAVAQMLDGTKARAVGRFVEIALVAGFALFGVLLGALHLRMAFRVLAGVLVVAVLCEYGFLFYEKLGVAGIPVVMPIMSFSLATWMTDLVTGREAKKQKEFIQSAFSRMVSPKIVNELIEDPSKLSIGGERRVMTFMFTDIAGFTTLSESVDTHKLAEVLNQYLNEACHIIQRHDGTVDKFIGDAIFAIFNAPTLQPDHEQRAVRCAVELDAFAEKFRAAQAAAGVPMGVTRIGVHTGEATIGRFGAEMRMEYTALGDSVNTASRLEGINKYFGTRVCISEATCEKIAGIAFRPLALIRPKGKLTSLEIFEPLDEVRAASPYIARYRAAYQAMENASPDGEALFAALHEEAPDDATVALHLRRLRAGEVGSEVIMDEK